MVLAAWSPSGVALSNCHECDPSWYDLRWCQDVKLQQPRNIVCSWLQPNICDHSLVIVKYVNWLSKCGHIIELSNTLVFGHALGLRNSITLCIIWVESSLPNSCLLSYTYSSDFGFVRVKSLIQVGAALSFWLLQTIGIVYCALAISVLQPVFCPVRIQIHCALLTKSAGSIFSMGSKVNQMETLHINS